MFTAPPFTNPNFLFYMAQPVAWAITIYTWIVIIRVLMSWFGPNLHRPSKFVRILGKLTDKPLALARRFCPRAVGVIDFSPVVLLIFLSFLRLFLALFLHDVGLTGSPLVIGPALAKSVVMLLQSLALIIAVAMGLRILMPLIKASPHNPMVRILYNITQPFLKFFSFLPHYYGLLDIRALVFLILAVIFGFVFLVYVDVWLDMQRGLFLSSQIAPRL